MILKNTGLNLTEFWGIPEAETVEDTQITLLPSILHKKVSQVHVNKSTYYHRRHP